MRVASELSFLFFLTYLAAVDELAGYVASGQIYTKDQDYITAFDQKNAVAGLVWSGDLEWGDEYGYVIDPAGATINTDSFIVPMGSAHKTNVEKLINHYYHKQTAAELILGGVVYVSPVDGIQTDGGCAHPHPQTPPVDCDHRIRRSTA